MRDPSKILYLHGLGSSPRSRKAELIYQHFTSLGFDVALPDITLPSLSKLSPRAVVSFVREQVIAGLDSRLSIIGSSFGAFVATRALMELSTEQRNRLDKLVLIAPVFDPFDERAGLLSAERRRVWREKGEFPLLDLEAGVERPVHYQFVSELESLAAERISYEAQTLVIHGRQDEVVPCSQSQEFAQTRPWVKAVYFDDNHQLLGDPQALLKVVEGFILPKSLESR